MQETSVYSGSFSVTQNGKYTVTVTDNAGNIGTGFITVTNIDKTKPEVTCTVDSTPNASGWYTANKVPVKLTFADNVGSEGGEPSGIKSVEYKLVSDTANKPTDDLTSLSELKVGNSPYTHTITNNGTYYFYYKVTDKAGNVTDGFSDEIKKDSCVSTPIITGPDEGVAASVELKMEVSFNYGPSGGSLYGGLGESNEQLATMESIGGMNVVNQTVKKEYQVRDEGEYSFRYHSNAFGTDVNSKFNVYKVTFDMNDGTDSTGGSADSVIPAQLVWHDNKDGIRCKVVEPAEPTRTGHTFVGWYTDVACTNGKQFDFNTQVTADTTLYAKWTVNTYSVTYNLKNPDGTDFTAESGKYSYTYGEGLELPDPVQEGYTFSGWYDNDDYTGNKYLEIGQTETENKTYYGYYEDIAAPAITATLSNGEMADGSKWYNKADRPTITLTYSDNKGISDILVNVDGSGYMSVNGIVKGNATQSETKTNYELTEGIHTYTFKAVDAAGNETDMAELTVKLDTIKPVFGTLTYDHKAKNFLDWIIGRESLIITVPVTEQGSGTGEISYTLTPVDGSTGSAEITGTAEVKDGEAKITVSDDFKGTVKISCSDAAGNAADDVTIGASGGAADGGVIVEDNAPTISALADRKPADRTQTGNTALSDSYYETRPAIAATVKDDTDNAVTAGIASVTYVIEETEYTAYPVTNNETALDGLFTFTIPADKIPTSTTTITIKAEDNAGNTASYTFTLKVKGPEKKPAAKIDYRTEKLTGLEPDVPYSITYTDRSGTEQTVDVPTTDGTILLKEEWIGGNIKIVKKGLGSDTTDSPAQEFSVPARTEAPSLSVENETGVNKKDGKLTKLTPNTAYDISKDGGKSWINRTADASGEITVEAPAEYVVRLAATDSGFRGPQSDPVKVDGYHIPVTFVANDEICDTSWAYYGKAPEKIPDVPKKADAEDKTFVGEWCSDEAGTLADFSSITAETTVYAVYTTGYNVTLVGGAGYTLAAVSGSTSPVKEGSSFTFKFAVSSGYETTGSFAVKVNGVKTALAADGTCTIADIMEDKTVTVEGITKTVSSEGSGSSDSSGSTGDSDNKPDDNTTGGDKPQEDGNKLADGTLLTGSDQLEDNIRPTNSNRQGGKNRENGTETANKEDTDGTQSQEQNAEERSDTQNEQLPEEEGIQIVFASTEDGRITVTGDLVTTGNITEATKNATQLAVGNGAVIVTVVCEEENCTAGVSDTVAVANAVLAPEQIQFVNEGQTIEIRVDVKDISETVHGQDKEVIESGFAESRKEIPDLTLGMYVDISMFIKAGGGDWDAITSTEEPIDVVVGIPEELKGDGREFYIIRSHDGEYTLLTDMDDALDTITVSTDRFSAYAIAYNEADKTEVQTPEESSTKCGLCHICPTFLGICYFIWLVIILAIVLTIWMVILWKRKQEKR